MRRHGADANNLRYYRDGKLVFDPTDLRDADGGPTIGSLDIETGDTIDVVHRYEPPVADACEELS